MRIPFELLEKDSSAPVSPKEIHYHMIYDVKMDLTRKARLVTGGRLNNTVSASMSYSFVVKKDSVRIGFMIGAMNDLDVLAADVGNVDLNIKPRVRAHVKIGPELFGV